MSAILIDEPVEGVKRLTLNRPQRLNVLTTSMLSGLFEALRVLRTDSKTRVVVLTGNGEAFCAGDELNDTVVPEWIDDPETGISYGLSYMLSEFNRLPLLMQQIPQPIICAVNGVAAGMGYSLALAADLCIAAQSANFTNARHKPATSRMLGLSFMLHRAVRTQRAAEILLTARPVPADEAERIGLVLRTVPDEQLMASAFELARAIMTNALSGVWLTKRSLWINQSADSMETAMELERQLRSQPQMPLTSAPPS